jgi:hypothetical protein
VWVYFKLRRTKERLGDDDLDKNITIATVMLGTDETTTKLVNEVTPFGLISFHLNKAKQSRYSRLVGEKI